MINNIYLNEKIISQMKEFLEKNSYLQLINFFETKPNFEFKNKKKIYSPLYIKRTQYEITLPKEIYKFIENLLNLKIKNNSTLFCEYKHQDFIIINDNFKLNDGYEIILDFTPYWEKKYGGTLTYVNKKKEIFYLEPSFNTLTIIKTYNNNAKYLKYINNLSKNNKIKRIEFFIKD